MTKVLQLTFSIIYSPADDALGSERELHNRLQVVELCTKSLRDSVYDHVPAGYLCTVIVGHRLNGEEEK